MGCGDGATLDLLEKQGYRALGLDLEPGRLRAEAYSARVGIRAEAERTPLADAVMDAVLCECVLSLLAEPSRALGECARIVRPGGALLLTDVYARNEDDGFCPTGERRLAEWSHLLAEAGFFLHVFEDHSQALAELAAKLAWYGEADLTAFFGLSGDARRSHRGYGLWIAQKEMPCTR
jgi:SAM-dependent methyltransferase